MLATMAIVGRKEAPMALTLESSAFRANGEIPKRGNSLH